MARPIWLRLFGRNGGLTFDEARDAFLTSGLGARPADSEGILQQLLRISDRGDGSSGGTRAQAGIAAATLAGIELQAASAAPATLAADSTRATEPSAEALFGADSGRGATLSLNGVSQSLMGPSASSPFAGGDLASQYIVLFSDDIQAGMVVDVRNKTLLQGGPGDYPELGAGPDDTLVLDGDYSAGFDLDVPAFVDQLVALGGNDYNLIADDASVAAGATLTVNAMPLRADNRMIFDGSAESDGRFVFYGGEAGDIFLGGAGDDRIAGLGGADILSGGGGRDTFVYTGAAESSGADFDILADFDPTADRIDLLGTVSGFGATITGGALSLSSFDADLGAAMGGLGASQAVWFAPDAGDLAGQIFLIVDANGIAGYQEGEDYVFAVAGAPLADLSGHTGFFV